MSAARTAARWLGRIALVALLLLVVALGGFRAASARRETSTRADAAPKGGRFVRAADVELFVQEEGPAAGEPVVLIHGTGAWSEIWRGTMHRLADAGYRAIALDMPPFGFSARPTLADYGDDAQGLDIAALIPGARWVSLPGAGHIPAIEDPDGFDAALITFLASALAVHASAAPISSR